MTALDMEQMGNVTAIMAKNDKGQARTVTGLVLLVNPVDYFRRVLPATRMLTPDGVYASVLPVDAEIIQSAAVKEERQVYGMASKYFLGVGMARNGRIEYSDEYRFLEDERVYLIKLYANGFAIDNQRFSGAGHHRAAAGTLQSHFHHRGKDIQRRSGRFEDRKSGTVS